MAKSSRNPNLMHQAASLVMCKPEKARDLYLKIVKRDKGNVDAWQMLGTLSAQLGSFKVAEKSFLQAVSISPQRPDLLYNLGYLYQGRGMYPEAIKYYVQALKLKSGFLEAQYNLATSMFADGQVYEAKDQFEQLLRCYPISEPVLTGLASVHLELKNHVAAIELAEQAIALNSSSAIGFYIIGMSSLACKEFKKAKEAFQQAVVINIHFAEAYFGLSKVSLHEGQIQDAASNLKSALEYKPDYPDALLSLGYVYTILGRPELSISCYEKFTGIYPKSAVGHTELAYAHDMAGNWDKSITHHKTAINLDGNAFRSVAGLAHIYEKRKEYKKALDLLKPVIDRGDADFSIILTYADVERSLGNYSTVVATLEETLKNAAAATPGIADIYFKLGGAHDKLGDYHQAIGNYNNANAILRQEGFYDYDNSRQKAYVDWCKKIFTKKSVVELPHARVKTELPVFIIGMPRSGTSLLEQILATHPDVYGAGELSGIYDVVDQLPDNLTNPLKSDFSDSLDYLSHDLVDEASKIYLEKLRSYSRSAIRITDKYPGNFLYLWMIELLFPDAHVLHCTRSPADTCLSIYFQHFTSSQSYSTSLKSLGEYYSEYMDLMEHWRNTLTIKILDVSYESMIQNQEEVMRCVSEFVDIPWSDNYMEFFNVKRTVNTPSYHQVRKPIYKTSSGRWKHYEHQIGELIDALGHRHKDN